MKLNTELLLIELYKAFSLFNAEFYDNFLPEPSITIQGKGNRKNTMGYCTIKKVWLDTINSKNKYEIAIIGEFLNRGMYPVLSTLLHEMVHLHSLVNDIKDVSRNGTYHNKKFKRIAEDHGLIIEKAERIGWSVTTLTEETTYFIEKSNLNEEAFSLIRLDPSQLDDDESSNKKRISRSRKRKYICPMCGDSVIANKEIYIICGNDKVQFEDVTEDED